MTHASPDSANRPHPWGWLGLIVAVALAARAVGLNGGLWIDEIYSLLDSFRPSLGRILTFFPGDTQHPLYSVLANVSLSVFGEAPWTVRLPAMVFGVASVPMLYLVGREALDRWDGLLAAAFLAVSYHHVWFSQNARGYTTLGFFALLSTWCLLRLMRTGGANWAVGYGLAIGLGVYTHVTMAFLVAAQALVGLIGGFVLDRRGAAAGTPAFTLVPRVFAGLVFGVVVGALLYLPIFTQVLDFFLNKPSNLEGVSTPSWALSEALRQLGIGLGAGVGILLALALVAAGTLSYLRRAPLALALFALPVVTTVGGALLARGTMYPRFFFFLAGFGVLIAVRGARVTGAFLAARLRPNELAFQRAVGLGLAAAMALGSAVLLPRNYRAPKQDYRGAMAWVDQQVGPTDAVVTAGVTVVPYRDYLERTWPAVEVPADVRRFTASGQRVWLLYTFPRYLHADFPELAAMVDQSCVEQRSFAGTVGDGAIIVCTFDADSGQAGTAVSWVRPDLSPGPGGST